MPKVSIIVPVYKAEKYINRCVDSIIAQTFTDRELLLIDDGSPDKSGEICDGYARRDKRIRVFHKKNGGVSSARNLGLDNVRGEYVTFVDADDCIYSGAVGALITNMECSKVDLVQCAFNRQFIEGEKKGNCSGTLWPVEYIEHGFLGTHVWGSFLKMTIIRGKQVHPTNA